MFTDSDSWLKVLIYVERSKLFMETQQTGLYKTHIASLMCEAHDLPRIRPMWETYVTCVTHIAFRIREADKIPHMPLICVAYERI